MEPVLGDIMAGETVEGYWLFIFLIRDIKIRAILFVGSIVNPAE